MNCLLYVAMQERTKTYKYLYPAFLFGYDDTLRKLFMKMYQDSHLVNAYIGDDNGLVENSFFMLIRKPVGFSDLIDYMQKHVCHLGGYETGKGFYNFHLRIPASQKVAYQQFLLSRYSRMYSQSFLDYFREQVKLPGGEYPPNYHVLAKTEIARQKVIDRFNLTQWFEADEYEGAWSQEEEVFRLAVPVA